MFLILISKVMASQNHSSVEVSSMREILVLEYILRQSNLYGFFSDDFTDDY